MGLSTVVIQYILSPWQKIKRFGEILGINFLATMILLYQTKHPDGRSTQKKFGIVVCKLTFAFLAGR